MTDSIRHLETEARAARRRLNRLTAQMLAAGDHATRQLLRAVDHAETQCDRAEGRWERAFFKAAA